MNITEFRAQYPQYDTLPDDDLATRLYQKHYADKLTPEDFGARFGVAPVLAAPVTPGSGGIAGVNEALSAIQAATAPPAPQETPAIPTEPFPTKGIMQTGPGLGDMLSALMPEAPQDGQFGYTGRGGVRARQAAEQRAITNAVQTLYPDVTGEVLAKAPGAGVRAAPEQTAFRQALDSLFGNPDAVPVGGDPNVALYLAGRQVGLDDAGDGRRFDAPTTAKRAREQIGPAEGVATRGAKDFTAGAIQTGGGLLGYAARMTGSNALREGQLKVTQQAADLMPSDQNFLDNLAAGAGSTTTFFVPGMGLAKGAQAVASVSPRMGLWLGSGAAAGMEAAVEAGAVYEQMMADGKGEKAAAKAADRAFWQNAGLLAVTNKLGLFGDTGGQLTLRTLGAAFEGGQEGV